MNEMALPVAAASGTFMMGTKGRVMEANRVGQALQQEQRKRREGGR